MTMAEKKAKSGFFSRRSLALRVILLSSLWVVAALLAIAWVSALFYIDANRRSFDRLLTTQLYSLVGSVNVDAANHLKGAPELGDIRYSDPTSGWYWQVVPISPGLKGELRSPSLGDYKVLSPSDAEVPFDTNFIRLYTAKGREGEHIRVIESDVVLGVDNRVARFRLMGNQIEVAEDFRQFLTTLRWYLFVLGCASLFINALIILFALRPLVRVRQAIQKVRTGDASHIDAHLPVEVLPLAHEMNALIDNNARIVERFRTQVGNLAHSLKTPLSVLSNEARSLKGDKGRILLEQTEMMRVQIEHYLARARIAAQRDSVIYRTDVRATAERLCRVMQKLHPHLVIEQDIALPQAIFAGEKEDLEEMLGNILENAAKWAKGRIVLRLQSGEKADFFDFMIEDDGPGLNEKQMQQALKRGIRLDESKPGTGLGLSIVADTITEYGGQIHMGRSSLGGLLVRLSLPQVGEK